MGLRQAVYQGRASSRVGGPRAETDSVRTRHDPSVSEYVRLLKHPKNIRSDGFTEPPYPPAAKRLLSRRSAFQKGWLFGTGTTRRLPGWPDTTSAYEKSRQESPDGFGFLAEILHALASPTANQAQRQQAEGGQAEGGGLGDGGAGDRGNRPEVQRQRAIVRPGDREGDNAGAVGAEVIPIDDDGLVVQRGMHHVGATGSLSQRPGLRGDVLAIQPRTVKQKIVDAAASAGGQRIALDRKVKGIRARDELTLRFLRAPNSKFPPIINALEIEAME
jgi:hypothetical protein